MYIMYIVYCSKILEFAVLGVCVCVCFDFPSSFLSLACVYTVYTLVIFTVKHTHTLCLLMEMIIRCFRSAAPQDPAGGGH